MTGFLRDSIFSHLINPVSLFFSLSDEGPDADAEHCQSEGAEREAEEQSVHVVLPPLERLQPPLSDCYSGRREREGSFLLLLALQLVHCGRQLPEDVVLRPVEDGLELVGGQALDVGLPLVQGEAGVVDELFDGRPHHRPRP